MILECVIYLYGFIEYEIIKYKIKGDLGFEGFFFIKYFVWRRWNIVNFKGVCIDGSDFVGYF